MLKASWFYVLNSNVFLSPRRAVNTGPITRCHLWLLVLFGQCLAIYPGLCLRAPRRSRQKLILIAVLDCYTGGAPAGKLEDLLVTALIDKGLSVLGAAGS